MADVYSRELCLSCFHSPRNDWPVAISQVKRCNLQGRLLYERAPATELDGSKRSRSRIKHSCTILRTQWEGNMVSLGRQYWFSWYYRSVLPVPNSTTLRNGTYPSSAPSVHIMIRTGVICNLCRISLNNISAEALPCNVVALIRCSKHLVVVVIRKTVRWRWGIQKLFGFVADIALEAAL